MAGLIIRGLIEGGKAAGRWLGRVLSRGKPQPTTTPRGGQQPAGKGSPGRGGCGAACKRPVRRHDPCKVKRGDPTKSDNSMIDPNYKDAINADIDQIIAGNIPKTGEVFNVNGRTFGIHNGTLFPMSGPGLVNVSRPQHTVIKALNEKSLAGGLNEANHLKSAGQITQEQIDEAVELWKKCKK